MARIRRVRPDGELPVRLFACTAAFTVAAAFCYDENGRISHLLSGPIHHDKLYTFSPSEAFFNAVTIAVLGGLLLSLPVVIYEVCAYLRPELRPMLVMAPGLFLVGVACGWYVVVPWALHSLTTFDSHEVHYLPRASDYLHFVMVTLLATGIAFELPGLMLLRKQS
jgi:sec-independent protein translocase protein TatC